MEAKPRLMPKVSSRTLATVARQLVVQEALDTSSCLTGSYFCSLTPSTTVMSGSLAGAVMTTFLAPACRCLDEVARSRKIPVDSTTIPTPISPQGSVAGSLAEQTRISRPLTKIASPLAFTSAVERAVDGVVLQEMGQRLGVGQVVDRHHLDVRRLQGRAKEHPADPSEPVHSDAHCHGRSPSCLSRFVEYFRSTEASDYSEPGA